MYNQSHGQVHVGSIYVLVEEKINVEVWDR